MWETHQVIGWRKVCLKNANYSKNVLLKHFHTKPNLYLTEVYKEKILLSFKGLWINAITVNIALCKSAQLGFPSFQRKADPLTTSVSYEIVHACLPQASILFAYMSSSEILCYLIGVTKKDVQHASTLIYLFVFLNGINQNLEQSLSWPRTCTYRR